MDSISTPGDFSPGVRVMEGLLEPGVGGREEVEQVERPTGGGLPPGKREWPGAAPPSTGEPAAAAGAAMSTCVPG